MSGPASWQTIPLAVAWLAIAVATTAAAEESSSIRSAAGKRPAPELAQRIDQEIQRQLDAAKVQCSPPADDAEFLRRVYLDLHGMVPPAERVVEFLDNRAADKRAAMIDELLASPEYGRHFGLVWFNRMVPRSSRALGLVDESLQPWLAERFNANRGWDKIVSDILISEGERDQNPATIFYLASVNDARNQRPEPDRVAAAVTRLFLGLRLECCQCHNHPFNELKQTDFWSMAAFFVNLRTETVEGTGKGPNIVPVLREGVAVTSVKGKLNSWLPISASATIEIPESNGKMVQARFLGGPQLAPQDTPRFRPALAEWLIAPTNRIFARAAVNRMWANFFGQGLIEPIDDMQPGHPATHPEVLDLLTDEFVASGFDLKHLIRCIANTCAYQRTSTPPAGRNHEPHRYSHIAARVMTADQLYDSLIQILKHDVGEWIANAGQKRKYGDPRERFRIYFHGAGDDDNTPVPAYGHGIPQVLRIMNSPRLTDGSVLIEQLNRRGAVREKIVESLYLATLSRRPTTEEARRVSEFLADEPDRKKGYNDLLWVLLNSGEFLHNH
jgi:hypothetical protein